jgi:hypothetical protein
LSVLLFYSVAKAAPLPDADEIGERAFPEDRLDVSDPNSAIAGATLLQLDENGRLKYSHHSWVVPLNDPEWRATAQAGHMTPDDPVLGFSFHGKSWALPWWIMKNHHLANLTLDGRPVLIAFCEACSSGIALDPVVDGRRLTFHLAGMYNGSILLADDKTKSYWTPFTGEALEGPLKGAKLKQMELVQCRWSEWNQLHPQGLVAYGPEQLRKGHGAHFTPGSPDPGFLRLLVKPLDKRLPFNDPILGVSIGGQARAYPIAALNTGPGGDKTNVVLNDTVGKDDIVILHRRGSWLTTAFNRRLRDKTLQFLVDNDDRFTDSTYHSHWNYEGEAIDGPVAGRKLASVASRVEEWYIWAAFSPRTSIYGSTTQGDN